MERSSSRSGSRSRRSYPLLNQISLTPLSARYPIDADDDDDDGDDDNTGTSYGDHGSRHSYYDGNDDQSQGYFSARSTSPERVYSGSSTPRTRTPPSYLASFSVPGTPGPLSHSHSQSESRSVSRTRSRRDRRSKSSSRMGSNLSSHDAEVDGRRRAPGTPGTPGQSHHQRASTSNSTSGDGGHRHRRHHGHAKSDSGWMLRTGIALAESTREEKGQSWLAKRQSSTSLASDAKNSSSAPSRPRSSKSQRPSSSGMSTPRWGSRSNAPSRNGSRPDLTMTTTGLEMTTSNVNRTSTTTPPSSGGADDHGCGFRPDMVNAQIRAEVALMQQQQQDGDGSGTLWQRGDRAEDDDSDDFDNDDDYYDDDDDDYDRWSFDSAEEIDEKEMYRLTRERGFGLGSWLDRMVEWTLFGVDEWPSFLSSTAPLTATPAAAAGGDAMDVSRELRDSQPRATASASGGADNDSDSLIGDTTEEGDGNSVSDRDDKSSTVVVDKSGETGGWEDARWLFHAMRRALF